MPDRRRRSDIIRTSKYYCIGYRRSFLHDHWAVVCSLWGYFRNVLRFGAHSAAVSRADLRGASLKRTNHATAVRVLTILTSVGIFCATASNALAEGSAGAANNPASSETLVDLKFGEVGSDVPLCQALMEEARKRIASGLTQCTAPIPSDDSRFGQVEWQILQPADHMELLQQIFVLRIVHGNWIPNSQSIGRDLQRGPPLNNALIQDVWDKYKRNYPDLVTSGKIHLERTSVDLAPGASTITIYRTNLISAPNQSGSSDWLAEDCYETSGQAPLPQWHLYYELRPGRWEEFVNLNSWVFGRTDLIDWAGRAYQIDLRNPAGFVVPRHISLSGSLFASRDLCVVHTIWK